ncbi:aldehyde dehydrogenase family protein [Adlercreutzia sp. R25]|uniref:Aldehyde dehydrogenase n=1 Tax=Adlercreutzia shanghongiae TaxID=3111773 RepID=A0ABU6IVK1_9ACTN|nr:MULTISPECIES: aldehyde dehydrogenase family protein [unclassified Adlercreutzia]MEC4272012.1 aldehyde dehydrogenase family protein [Adlercreutzia sp. R25]MEC4293743.1 aldehyde dehydrogenase family protein [Adlercreutzia sp. R22]
MSQTLDNPNAAGANASVPRTSDAGATAAPAAGDYGVATSVADVQNQVNEMQAFFETGVTLPVAFRLRQLRRLQDYLVAHEREALDALRADLGKSAFEAYATELGLVYDEIRLYLKKLRRWARPRRVPTSLAHFPSTSTVYPRPYGVAAVLSPWNYPLQLSLVPLVDAIGAGNCVALKPSKASPHTSAFLRTLCRELFDPRYVYCWRGSSEMNDWLLQVEFDKILFTGSPRVGKEIMAAAAQNLTSVTLELGGKSPVLIAADADIRRAGQRIAWGKCLNAGQTCVGPDYVLVHEDVADQFVEELEAWVHKYYGADVLASPDYPRMINQRHYDMVCKLIDERPEGTRIAFGGGRNADTLQIEPTAVTGVTIDDPLMSQEIFGPALPIITWRDLDEALAIVRSIKHPLACYVFSQSRDFQQRILRAVRCGGATINDVVIHASSNRMGFGGVQNSGIGAYHGKVGFDAFTHYQSTMRKSTLIETGIRNPPFDESKLKLLKLFMPGR